MSLAKIILCENGKPIKQYRLIVGESVTVGKKGCGAQLEVDAPVISRKHLCVLLTATGLRVTDIGSKNGTFVNGVRIAPGKEMPVNYSDIITLASGFTYTIRFEKVWAQPPVTHKQQKHIQKTLAQHLEKKNKVYIGRSAEKCDIVLSDNTVSRIHASVIKTEGAYWIEDLNSTNGTFVNGKRINTKVKIGRDDKVFIGLSMFQIDRAFKDLSKEAAIQTVEIEKNYNKGKPGKKFVGLHKATLLVQKNDFVALMGPSGCGKSTLLKAMNGDTPPDTGSVYIHGLELTENYCFIKRKIGYVPQDDIVHRDLSVYDSLYFAAKLRIGDHVSKNIIEEKITEALTSLNINSQEIRKKKVRDLSGGQRKRVSIAVELLTSPSILFLDEPTSPLDPETIEEFLKCLRRLTETGTTVVMVTHKPEDLSYVDRVIFMGTEGYPAYFGEKDQPLLDYFRKADIIGIYALLSNGVTAAEWYHKWRERRQHESVLPAKKPVKESQESLLRQLFWLSKRYHNLKMNDSMNMLLLFAQPVIIAVLISLVFTEFKMQVLFLMAITSVWFGVSNAAKEIVSEVPIYRRERMFNLNIHTYLLSKIYVLSLISFLQIVIFTGIVYLRYLNDEQLLTGSDEYVAAGMGAYLPNVLYLTWISFSAILLGLMLSAWFSTSEKVMTVVPIALIPQIMLAGIVSPINNKSTQLLSYLILGRWGTEGLARIQDIYGDGFVASNQLNEYDDPVWVQVDAHASLDLYKDDLYQWFNTEWLEGPLLVTLCLNIIIYIFIVALLNKKDSLK